MAACSTAAAVSSCYLGRSIAVDSWRLSASRSMQSMPLWFLPTSSRRLSTFPQRRITLQVAAEPLTSSNIELPSTASANGDGLPHLPDSLGQSLNALSEATSSDSSFDTPSVIRDSPAAISETLNETYKGSLVQIDNFFSGVTEYVDMSIGRVDDAVKTTYDAFTLSFSDKVKSVTESFDSATRSLFSSVGDSKGQASNELTGFSIVFKESIYRTGNVAVDILRQTIITIEDSLANAASFVVYSYGSSKSLLPPEVSNVLNLSEEKAVQILRPLGTACQQVSFTIAGFEKNLGLDPNDPVVPFILFLGSAATIRASYWLFKYGGYSGDLLPELTLELLKNEDNAVLIDVRPEDLRERDGVPDLRRGARSKYASVTLPKLDASLRKLLKSGKDIDATLVGVVIRNLKMVKDGSKVIVMDAGDGRAKAVARSLKKLGVKKPYLVQGGFQSWVRKSLHIKELKSETTLTVLSEEAEAILEEIRPTPLLVIGYGLGILAAIYALLEWEKTLQVIGVVGLGQTLYQRVASYEDSEDLKQDMRLLLAPARVGAQAISWAAGKLEPNKIGLPTSPSSTAVQVRVQQAVAKHEAQPSDADESQVLPQGQSSQENEKLDLSDA